jgi:hypothetical protein
MAQTNLGVERVGDEADVAAVEPDEVVALVVPAGLSGRIQRPREYLRHLRQRLV